MTPETEKALIDALTKSTTALEYLRDAVPPTMLRALNNNIAINKEALKLVGIGE